jgi:hypothetical protein
MTRRQSVSREQLCARCRAEGHSSCIIIRDCSARWWSCHVRIFDSLRQHAANFMGSCTSTLNSTEQNTLIA